MKLRFAMGEPIRELTRDERYAFWQGCWIGFGFGLIGVMLAVVF